MCERLSDEEKGAARSLVAKGRARVGPEPTEQELWAYHLGEMSTREEDRFAERLAHYPEAAKWLARLTEGEPGNGAAGGDGAATPLEVTAEDTEAAWERWLRDRGGEVGKGRRKRSD